MTVWTIILLVLGMVLLIKGADFFVDGASSIAKTLKIPTIIIGLTLVSIGTTLPEAAVSITTALQESDGMSIGNVVGSNIFNTMLILGLSVTLIPVAIDKEMRKSYLPILCSVYALLIIFSFLLISFARPIHMVLGVQMKGYASPPPEKENRTSMEVRFFIFRCVH